MGEQIESLKAQTFGGLNEEQFREQAELTKKTCPVSVALSGIQINLNAKLASR